MSKQRLRFTFLALAAAALAAAPLALAATTSASASVTHPAAVSAPAAHESPALGVVTHIRPHIIGPGYDDLFSSYGGYLYYSSVSQTVIMNPNTGTIFQPSTDQGGGAQMLENPSSGMCLAYYNSGPKGTNLLYWTTCNSVESYEMWYWADNLGGWHASNLWLNDNKALCAGNYGRVITAEAGPANVNMTCGSSELTVSQIWDIQE